MRVLLVDESLELLAPTERALTLYGAELTFAYSRQTSIDAFTGATPHDLILVNLTDNLIKWDLPQTIRQFGHEAVTVVFHAPNMSTGIECFAGIPRCEKVARPPEVSDFDTLIPRIATKVLTSHGSPLTSPPDSSRRISLPEPIVGKSKKMLEVFSLIEKVAAGNANVCIFGESGTGKELIARAIHYNSPRRDRPLITFDCTAVPDGLVESHLFGHVKGAFTSAIDHREGVFSLANTGTLFIDELGEFSLPLQAKLLRVIQSREFLKVGGTKPQKTDIRLITATNKDLRKAVENGTFREDLYYRIVVVTIHLPALRERREDIPLLIDHFLKKVSRIHRKTITGFTPRSLEFLVEFPWPGNVRQLENCIEQAVVLTENETIDLDVPQLSDSSAIRSEPPILAKPGLSLRELERRYILRTLEEVGGNRTRAAKILGISLRGLQYKLKSYTFEEAADASSLGVSFPEGNQKALRGAFR